MCPLHTNLEQFVFNIPTFRMEDHKLAVADFRKGRGQFRPTFEEVILAPQATFVPISIKILQPAKNGLMKYVMDVKKNYILHIYAQIPFK